MWNFPLAMLFALLYKTYKNDFFTTRFWKVEFVKKLEEVFWKVISLRTLKIITLGPMAQRPTNHSN
jgi:hypothetical protein